MEIKRTVFGSGSEKQMYAALHSRWSAHFNLWPSLPFLSIIDVDGDEVSPPEYEFLKTTSVDITLCTKQDDRPILSIEFDGMGHGFSREGKYIQTHPTQDRHRKLKLDLKLAIAGAVKYPLVILSYEEKNPIGPDLTLTVADGIIGQIVAKRRMHQIIKDRLAQEPIEGIHPDEAQAELDWVVDSADVQAKLEWNPVARLALEYEVTLSSLSIIKGAEVGYPFPPDLPDLEYPQVPGFMGEVVARPTTESLLARRRRIEETTRVGGEYCVDTEKGRYRETVWLREITGLGVSSMELAEHFAKILVLRKVAAAYGISEEEIVRRSHGK